MLELNGKTVSLVGFGVSNRAMCRYLTDKGIYPTVRCLEKCALPCGVNGIFGKEHLNVSEDIVFRSPAIRPEKISNCNRIYTESIYALEHIPSFKIGITGSDGKTTTSTLVYLMLLKGNKSTYLCGNMGSPIINLTSIACKNDILVSELSSFQLYKSLPVLDVGVITNITPNHLDWHADIEEYIQAKKNITVNAKRTVLNYDDLQVRDLARKGKTAFFSLYSRKGELCSDYDFVYVCDGNVYYNSERLFPVSDICLKGDFNIKNVLCAIGCAYPFVGKDACHSVAKEFCGVEHRMEKIGDVNGVFFIDSAIDSTPSRTLSTLSAFEGEKTVAIMGGYDKNLSYSCLKATLEGLKAVVVFGENRDKIINGLSPQRVITVNNMDEAVSVSYKIAGKGDFVILTPASASFDMYKNYKEKADSFKRAVYSLTK